LESSNSRWRLRPHRYEFFRRRGMNANGSIELRLGGAAVHGHGQPLYDFAGIRPDHMAAQDFIRLGIHDDFHHDLVLAAG